MTGSDLFTMTLPLIATAAVALTGMLVVYKAVRRKPRVRNLAAHAAGDLGQSVQKGLFPVVLMSRQQIDAYRSMLGETPHAAE
jgi:hypothetical protein